MKSAAKVQKMSFVQTTIDANPRRWAKTNDLMPVISVNQETREVTVSVQEASGYQKNASVQTDWCEIEISEDGLQMYVRGQVTVKNWNDWRCSGTQKFCFAVFVGDTQHIYVHRAPSTKGWMEAKPEGILARLRKLGIGCSKVAYQQGDFLLKAVDSLEGINFKHETMGAGHHKFTSPVLYVDYRRNRFYLVKDEPVTLVHYAIDGLQHPTQIVAPGIYMVGTTASQLSHKNKRD